MIKISDDELILELKKRFKQNKDALDELQTLTHQLKDMNHKLEESEQIKSHFLSHIRNEIINPLASIIGISENLSLLKNFNKDKIQNLSRLIYSEAFELDQQLKNIFAAAEIEAGDFNPEFTIIELEKLIDDNIQLYKTHLKEKNIHINLEVKDLNKEEELITDITKFSLSFTNILKNAIKYSYPDSNIDIYVEKNDKKFIFSVKDYGIGIDPKNLNIIFDRFKKIDNSINSINKGHGLGLSVSLASINVLNGKITIESEPEKGALFTVSMPIINSCNLDNKDAILNDFLFNEDDTEIF